MSIKYVADPLVEAGGAATAASAIMAAVGLHVTLPVSGTTSDGFASTPGFLRRLSVGLLLVRVTMAGTVAVAYNCVAGPKG